MRVVAAVVGLAAVALVVLGPPRAASAIVAVKPRGLPSLQAQEEAIRLVSGGHASTDPTDPTDSDPAHPHDVQLVVLQRGADVGELLARGEHLASGLAADRSVDHQVVESLSAWLPSPSTIAARLAERDRLDLPARADALEKALRDEGFAAEPFAPALDRFRHPATLDVALEAATRLRAGVLAPLVARHLARDRKPDGADGDWLLATYVRAPGLSADALRAEVAPLDAGAVVTGYPVLEQSLRAALGGDLPRVALVALVLVVIALRTVLRGWRAVIVAVVALAAELLFVALVVRVAHVPLHVYDALVLPVLIGITVDESMFLLEAMRRHAHEGVVLALQREGRAVVATATTTAAGFAALLVCHFPGLRDLGAIGVVGTLVGLLASLVVVPAAARVARIGGDR